MNSYVTLSVLPITLWKSVPFPLTENHPLSFSLYSPITKTTFTHNNWNLVSPAPSDQANTAAANESAGTRKSSAAGMEGGKPLLEKDISMSVGLPSDCVVGTGQRVKTGRTSLCYVLIAGLANASKLRHCFLLIIYHWCKFALIGNV